MVNGNNLSHIFLGGGVVVSCAFADQTAPDITIHDSLDTDSAYVSQLKLTSMVTGTEPFDADNERGNDQNATNKIVRSFDTVVYNYDYVMTSDDTMTYYRKARVGFRFELPYPTTMVTFDTNQMGWVDTSKGFEAKTTTETINGVKTQVFTAYRLLSPSSSTPTVVPGSSGINFALKVLGAPNGYQFTPKVTAWMVPNSQQHRTITDTPPMVTVSAKPSYNIRLAGGKNESSSNLTFDFTTKSEYVNNTLGKQQGLMSKFPIAFDMRWRDRAKGLKGIELPQGDISFDITVSNLWRDEGASSNHKPEALLQPYFWSWSATEGARGMQSDRYNALFAGGYYPRFDEWSYAKALDYGDPSNVVFNNGQWIITQTRGTSSTTLHVTIHDYQIDPNKFPYFAASYDPKTQKCSTQFMNASCSQFEVAEISVGTLYLFNPTTIHGKTVSEYYAHDVTLQHTVTDRNLKASSVTGMSLPTVNDNSNQARTDDDTWATTLTLRLPGSFIQQIMYTCQKDPFWNNGNDCSNWTSQDANHGTDSVLQGGKQRIIAGYSFTFSKQDLPVLGLNLVTWDTNILETSPNGWDTLGGSVYKDWNSSDNYGVGNQIWYAVKKDGTTWKSDDEQRNTSIADLNYYTDRTEALSHGVIVGALLGNRTAAPTEKSGHSSYYVTNSINLNVKTTAPLGAVAQTTGYAVTWTRSQLVKAGVTTLNPTESSDSEWEQWANSQNPLTMFHTVKPYYTYGSEPYQKAKYGPNGYEGGDTGGSNRGDSLYIVGETPKVSKVTAQTSATGDHKTIYDLDKEQRYVDWDITARATTLKNNAYTTDYTITDTLPKGLSYIPGSSRINGTYTEHTPDKGTVENGEQVEPTIVNNSNGTTTLTWTVTGRKADNSPTYVRFTTMIGDASNPDTDAKNNDQYTNTVSIMSSRNKSKPDKIKGTVSDYTIRVSRTHSSALATRANPLLNDIHAPLGFKNMLGNFSTDEKTNVYAVNVMPWMGVGSSSNYQGSYSLTGLTATGVNGASLQNVAFYFTTDPQYRTLDPVKITRDQIITWHKAVFDPTTGKVTIPTGFDKPVAWAFTSPRLPSNARYDFTLTINPTDNKALSSYVNTWSDGDNKVTAVTQVVERTVNGVAWFDRNNDGIRADTDPLLKNVHVQLETGQGQVVTSLTGQPLTTVTDEHGFYEFTNVPAGTGYRLRFTPASGGNWLRLKVTVRNAANTSEANDSDSSPVTTNNQLTAATIDLQPFPTVDTMQTALYTDPNEDHGLTGSLLPAITPSVAVSKTLTGRDWKQHETFKVSITPKGSAPAQVFPTTIQLSKDNVVTLKPDSSQIIMPGEYSYTVREVDTKTGGITYDSHVWTITVLVQENLTEFSRAVSMSLVKDTTSIPLTDGIRVVNTYLAQPVETRLQAQKTYTSDNGRPVILEANRFLFRLENPNGSVLDEARNTATGVVEFNPLRFTKTGVYSYQIREQVGDDRVEYDTRIIPVQVTVTDDGNGSLQATVTYDGGKNLPTFTNKALSTIMLPLTGSLVDVGTALRWSMLTGLLVMLLTACWFAWRRIR